MKKRIGFFVEILILVVVVSMVFSVYSYLIKPKYVYGDGFPTTSTYRGFYEQKRDSIDVLWLGSSHGVTAFNPLVLSEEYGITSYNLSCEQQNLFTSYYWLEEALKYQNPKTLVLECYMLFLFENEELAPTTANCTHKAFDFMKLSSNKIKAAKEANLISEDLDFANMLLANVMYHDRWKELKSSDLRLHFSDDDGFLRGYYPLEGYGVEGFEPFDSTKEQSDVQAKPNSVMLEYLNLIIELCRQKNIELILVSTPTSFETYEEHKFIDNLAQSNGVEFVDFNEKNVYESAGYSFGSDNNDDDHANSNGAVKITKYLAEHYLK